jgi:hypothetical protein
MDEGLQSDMLCLMRMSFTYLDRSIDIVRVDMSCPTFERCHQVFHLKPYSESCLEGLHP